MGLIVARTKTGLGKIDVSPSTVTCRLPIASRRAECVALKDDLVENWSHLESETSTHGIVNINPDDIGGNEVGSELNTFETAAKRFCERFGKCGLAGARNIFDQRVPAAQKGDQRASDRVPFSDEDPLHVIAHALGQRLDGERRCVCLGETLRCVVQTDMSRIGCICQN